MGGKSDKQPTPPTGQTLFEENRPLLALHAGVNALVIVWTVFGIGQIGTCSEGAKATLDLWSSFLALILPSGISVLFVSEQRNHIEFCN